MYRSLLISVLTLFTTLCMAQVEQHGRTMLYNGAKPKTPLAGVSISAYGAATTQSASDGKFTLQFRTLHPGDKVNIRRLEKANYEVFNTEALEQWYITRSNITYEVILCETATLNQIKDKYRQAATQVCTERLQKAESEAEMHRKEGLITEEEYQKRIDRLEAEHESQLDKIDTYVDRIARIDLSTISQEEQIIIGLIEQGKFDEAIQAYDKLQLIDKYRQERASIQKLNEAQKKIQETKDKHEATSNDLYAAVLRQVDLLVMTGGTANIQKARENMLNLYWSDSTQVRPALDLARFLIDHHDYKEANHVLEAALPHCQNWREVSNTKSLLASLQIIWGKYENSQKLLLECLELCNANMTDDEESSLSPLLTIYNTYYTMANNCLQLDQDSLADLYNRKAFETAERVYAIDSTRTCLMAKINFSRGNLLCGLERYEEARAHLEKCLELYTITPEGKAEVQTRARCKGILGNTLMHLGEKEKAILYTQASTADIEELYKRNPSAHIFDLGLSRFQAAVMFEFYKDKEKFLENIDGAISTYTKMAQKNPEAYNSTVEYIKTYREEVIKKFDNTGTESEQKE